MAGSVFIGWSGERSRQVASALRLWLPCFARDVAAWTSDDLRKGRRWREDLAERLAATPVAILCVTSDNLQSPWLNYEAGVVSAANARARVVPYHVGAVPLVEGTPIAQFQGVQATRAGTWELLLDVVDGGKPARQLFEASWPLVERVLAGPESSEDALMQLEALKLGIQTLKLDDVRLSSQRLGRGEVLKLEYLVSTEAHLLPVWLGANLWDDRVRRSVFNGSEDIEVQTRRGAHRYVRTLTIPGDAAEGDYVLNAEVWYGERSQPDNSYALDKRWPAAHGIHIG